MPKDIYTDAGRKIEISKEEQWDRLLKPKTGTLQERERLKHQKEAQEVISTFLTSQQTFSCIREYSYRMSDIPVFW